MTGLATGLAVKAALDKVKDAAKWFFLHPAWAVTALACLFALIQWHNAGHWHKLSDRNAQLAADTKKAFADTVAGYRAAAEAARKADAENKARVEAAQKHISQERLADYEKDLAALRARYAMLLRARASQAHPGAPGTEAVPGLPDSSQRANDPAGQDGLPASDALTASEIALRLKALQDWLRDQEAVPR